MKVKRPDSGDLWLAAQWLKCYEGDEDQRSCERVAKWLEAQAAGAEIKEVAKEAGIPVAALRKRLADKR